MAVRVTEVVGGLLLGAVALPALACDLPTLPVIPVTAVGDQASAVTAATGAYFDGIKAYAGCIESSLTAAGGDGAPASVKSVLMKRSQAAVAEAAAVQKLYQERVAGAASGPRATESALRKLVEGLATGMPDYEQLTPEMQRLTKQQLAGLQSNVGALGAVTNLEFTGVNPRGWDTFQVHGENGAIPAMIHLDADGKIDGALLQAMLKTGEKRPTATIPRRH